MERFIQTAISGVAVGGIYAMAALGFVLVFKATRIINFAQGLLMTLGGYMGLAFAVSLAIPIPIAFLLSAVVVSGVGSLMYVSSLAPVSRRGGNTEFAQVIITIGWSIMISATIQYFWGPVTRSFPDIFPQGVWVVSGVRVPYEDLGTIAITVGVVLVFTLIFNYTRFGLIMRGVADNRQAAVILGASERMVSTGAWALATAAAAVAGVTLTSYVPLGLTFGDIALMAFPAVVIGGIDSVPGGLVGGVLVGVVQQMAAAYIDPGIGLTAGFTVMLVVLLIRPSGLFGSPEVARV